MVAIEMSQQTQPQRRIGAGDTLHARSACDQGAKFTATVIERKGKFATIHVDGEVDPQRRQVRTDDRGEFILALGRYSMAPCFRL